MQQAPIVLTGLSADDCADFGAACRDAGKPVVHWSADVVLAAPDAALDGVAPWIFWLYHAPWQVRAGVPVADAWLALHRQLLRQRPAFGQRLVLVNVDADHPVSVLVALGLADMGAPAAQAQVAASAAQAELSALLAKAFDWVAPVYWDVFEALEAAVPDTGRAPMFRTALPLPDADQASVLHALVMAGTQLPALQAELAAERQALERGSAERKAMRDDTDQLVVRLRGAEAQVDALTLEVHALRELVAAAALDKAGLQADLAARDQLIQDDRAKQQQLADQGRAKLAELEDEHELALQQLHHVQEELEKLFLDNRQLSTHADKAQAAHAAQAAQLAEATAELTRRANQISAGAAALKKSQDATAEAQAELAARAASLAQAKAAQAQLAKDLQAQTTASAAALKRADQGRAKVAELEGENELLLQQLHQTQEELERLFLDKRQLAADASQAQAEQAADLASARSALKQEVEKHNASHAAQEQLAGALQRESAALAEARHVVEQGRAHAVALEKQNTALLLEMHLVQSALEQQFLGNQRQAAAAERRLADQAAQAASMHADLAQQAQALEARAAALADALAAQEQALVQSQGANALAQAELAAQLGQSTSAHDALAQQAQALEARAAALADALAAQEQALAQSQEATAQAHAELAAQAEALAQADAAQAQLAADLQARQLALAEAQQLAEQGQAQAAQLEGENDLLLLQLHQAQADLDQHASQNRQLNEVMGQSSQSLDRARRLISRLMLPAPATGEAAPLAQAAPAAPTAPAAQTA